MDFEEQRDCTRDLVRATKEFAARVLFMPEALQRLAGGVAALSHQLIADVLPGRQTRDNCPVFRDEQNNKAISLWLMSTFQTLRKYFGLAID